MIRDLLHIALALALSVGFALLLAGAFAPYLDVGDVQGELMADGCTTDLDCRLRFGGDGYGTDGLP